MGLGQAISLRLAREGAKVVVAGRTESALRSMAEGIRGEGGAALAAPTDVSDEAQVQALVAKTVSHFGGLDILVNNAGRVGRLGDMMSMPAQEWLEAYRVNVMGTLFCSREALKAMMPRRKGAIVNISSLAAATGFLPTMPYNASKAAVNVMTTDLARLAAAHNVRVNALLLGPVDPGEGRRATTVSGLPPTQAELWAMFGLAKPPGKMLTPDDIAASVAFLASDEAVSITGQLIQLVTRLA